MSQPFHGQFEKELLDEISILPRMEIETNTLILKEGAFIHDIPLLFEGSIKVRKTDMTGKEIVLYHIQPGESCILSITSCMNEKLSNAEAITEKKSVIYVASAELVRLWMDRYKSWRKFVLSLYYSRLDELLSLVDDIAFKNVDMRLLDKLRELQQQKGNAIPITHQELASEIGSAREVVSRLLKQLENQGKISLERGIIKIVSAL